MRTKWRLSDSLPSKARVIIKRIIEQATEESAEKRENSNYAWVSEEIKKEPTSNIRRDLISHLLRRLNAWYEEKIDKNEDLHLGIFYLQITYFLYALQFDDLIMRKKDTKKTLKIEISYTILNSLSLNSLSPETEEILSYLIYKNDLKIVLKWEEYRHISNRSIHNIENTIEDWLISATETSTDKAMQEYTNAKGAYLVMQTLLK